VTTLESPFAPCVAHYPLVGIDFAAPGPPAAIGDDERPALGEPDEIRFAHLSPRSVTIDMRFGETDCNLSWVDLPGIAGSDRRDGASRIEAGVL